MHMLSAPVSRRKIFSVQGTRLAGESSPNWAQDEGSSRPEARPKATAIALYREPLCLAAEQTIYLSHSGGAFENFKLTEAQKG